MYVEWAFPWHHRTAASDASLPNYVTESALKYVTVFTNTSTKLAVGLAAELALIQPGEVAAQLAAKGTRPVLFHVGPNLLYRGKHIPGSIYAGPGSRAEGLEALKVAAGKLPRDRDIILYCGCCPWSACPNVKPAVEVLKQMGFSHVKTMYVETNFAKDWIDKGYPVELGSAKQ